MQSNRSEGPSRFVSGSRFTSPHFSRKVSGGLRLLLLILLIGPAGVLAQGDGNTEPDGPQNLVATSAGRAQINLSWDLPISDGGTAITGYRIDYSINPQVHPLVDTGWETALANTGNVDRTYSHDQLDAETTYYYRVFAINSIGRGRASDRANATTDPAVRPGAPTGLTATASGKNQIDLSWTAPSDDGGAAITGYKIEVSPDGTTNSWNPLVASHTGTNYPHTGLQPGTTRYYRVYAINRVGESTSPSNVNNATTDAILRPSKPRNLTATPSGYTRIDLSWAAPSSNGGAPITSYRIEVSPDGANNNWSDLVPSQTGTSYAHTGLAAGTTQYYRVYATNSAGEGASSDVANATTVAATRPDKPRNLTATPSGYTRIDLSWTAPSNSGGAPITSYRIEVSPDGANNNWSDLVPSQTGTSYAHTGLAAGTTQYYRVYATNSAGEGAASDVANTTTVAATRPGAPTGLTATRVGRTRIDLSWDAPSNSGGAPITSYRIEVSPDGANNNWSDLVPSQTGTSYAHTGLAAGTTQYYRVYATNSVDESDASSAVSATTEALSTPGQITGLTATPDSPTQVTLSWTAPSDNGGSEITGYRIEASTDGVTFPVVTPNTGNANTTYVHSNLSPGTTYAYFVFARNAQGLGSRSHEVSATTPVAAAPGAPTGFNAQANGRTQIDLSWTAPSETNGAPITGYQIEVSTNSGTAWSDLVEDTEKTATAYEHTGLQPNTTRHYRVRAINSAGPGSHSNIDNATTDAASAPDAPTGLNAQADGQTRVDLNWTAPSETGGMPITGYRIEVSPNGTNGWDDLVDNTGNAATTYPHTGLTAGTTRHYRVYAINSVDESPASNMANATTDAASAPDAPTGLSATASGRTDVILSWNAPSENGGAPITGYRIEVSSNAGTTWADQVRNTGNPTTTYTDAGLTPGAVRQYRVSAINSADTGDPSSVVSVTVGVTSVPDAPTGLSATAAGRTQINLSWSAPVDNGGAAINGYRIQVSSNGTSGWTDLVEDTGSAGTAYEHTGLQPGTTRHYRIYANNSVGESTDASNIANATTALTASPGAPANLVATASGRTDISLSWTAPTDNGGAAITGYQIEVSSDAGDTWSDLEANTGSAATTYTHTGLMPGTTRHYRVRAVNSIDAGAPSNVDNATTDALSAPDAPTGLTAITSEQMEINLSWAAPLDNGGADISGYRIEASSNGGTSWSDLVTNTGSTVTTYTHTGLARGATRHYRVYALNAIGESAASNETSATTGAVTAPDAPTGLTATLSGQTEVNLSWEAPSSNGGAVITGYRIQVSTNEVDTWSNLVANTGSAAMTYTHTGVASGTTYQYRVYAINAIGESASPSNVASVSAGTATVPNAPTGLTATVSGQTEVNLSWEAPSSNGGAVITGYRIEVSTNEVDTWSNLVANTGSATTTYTHTGLASGTTYQYPVYAINAIGESSSPSNVASVSVGTAPRPNAPTGLTATSSGQTEIILSWMAPTGAPVTGYRIQVSTDGGTTWVDVEANTGSSATTYTHTGLTPGTTLQYRVYAINSKGESAAASSVVSVTVGEVTEPSAPAGLTATSAAGQTEISLSWTAPAGDGGAAISGYQIEMSMDGGTVWSDLVANTGSTATTYTHTGLTEGTTRHYRVRAINSVGASAPSNVAAATAGVDVNRPSAPMKFAAVADGEDTIFLSWSTPLRTGVSSIIGYRIDVSENNGTRWDKLADVNVTDSTYRHAGLPPGSTRYYRILARNSLGLGTPSTVVSATTEVMTSIELSEEIPADFSLEQNYPNPFNPSTAIEFSLNRTGPVTLTVYDLLGQKVHVLVDGVQSAGRHNVLFNGTGLASDTYIYVLQTQEQRAVKLMTLLK